MAAGSPSLLRTPWPCKGSRVCPFAPHDTEPASLLRTPTIWVPRAAGAQGGCICGLRAQLTGMHVRRRVCRGGGRRPMRPLHRATMGARTTTTGAIPAPSTYPPPPQPRPPPALAAALNSGSANERSLKGGTMEAALDSGSANDSGSAISVPPYRLVPPMKGRPYPLGHWGSGRTMATAL